MLTRGRGGGNSLSKLEALLLSLRDPREKVGMEKGSNNQNYTHNIIISEYFKSKSKS